MTAKAAKSLETAVDELQMPKSQTFHAALSDAYYTAEVLKILPYEQIFEFYSIDYFRTPSNRKEEISVIFDGYSKFVSKEFAIQKRTDEGPQGYFHQMLSLRENCQEKNPLVCQRR